MDFEVNRYSIDKLLDIITTCSLASPEVIKSKHHSVFFDEYFKHLNAKTIVVEHNYIDRDYLEDFASYYVRCFDDYERKCTRLHFFKFEFDKPDLTNFLQHRDSSLKSDLLTDNYLGFIIIKKLPNTVIGRSCLRTYDDDSHRFFPMVRPYKANLYGIDMLISSVAFQEQDSVVAACATSALWSIFHCTGLLFHHHIPSPAEITKKASEYLPTGTLDARIFPNRGLSIEQMAYAIRDVSLDPYLVNPNKQFVLQSTVYAYARGKIPSLLGIILYNVQLKTNIGRHAVAITGYNIDDNYVTSIKDSELHLKAYRISKFYVHDDQVGPFARMVFDNINYSFTIDGVAYNGYSLLTYWADNNRATGSIRAIPTILLIPLYNKIRIPFASILNCIIYFNSFIEFLKSSNYFHLPGFLEWDIYLTSVNDFKTEILSGTILNNSNLSTLLINAFPHYMWRATAFIESQPIIDILFDATDIEQGSILLMIIEYDKSFTDNLRNYIRIPGNSEAFLKTQAREILNWFLTK